MSKLSKAFRRKAGIVKKIDLEALWKRHCKPPLQTAPKSSKKTRSKNAREANDINIVT